MVTPARLEIGARLIRTLDGGMEEHIKNISDEQLLLEIEERKAETIIFFKKLAKNTPTISEKIGFYNKIIKIDPDNTDAFDNLGNIYASFDKKRSKYYWEISVQINLKKIELFKEYASSYFKNSDDYKSIKIEKDDMIFDIGECYYCLGAEYDLLEKYSQASESYKKAFEMVSTQVHCLYNIGMSLYNDGKLEESKKYLVEFITKESSYQAHYCLGLIYHEENLTIESLKEFWKCIEEAGTDSNSDYHRANSYTYLGNVKFTEKYLKLAIQKDPESLELLYEIVRYYEGNQQGQKAYEYYGMIKEKRNTMNLMKKLCDD